MRLRRLKECMCGYSSHEIVDEKELISSTSECTCPQCGGSATRFLYVDKRNLPDPVE